MAIEPSRLAQLSSRYQLFVELIVELKVEWSDGHQLIELRGLNNVAIHLRNPSEIVFMAAMTSQQHR